MTGLVIFIMIMLLIIAPEVYVLAFAFIAITGYGILEFSLRLFGKSFDGQPNESKIKDAYINYAKSHERILRDGFVSVTPMEHSYDSFARKCKEDRQFYNKYKSDKIGFKLDSDKLNIKF